MYRPHNANNSFFSLQIYLSPRSWMYTRIDVPLSIDAPIFIPVAASLWIWVHSTELNISPIWVQTYCFILCKKDKELAENKWRIIAVKILIKLFTAYEATLFISRGTYGFYVPKIAFVPKAWKRNDKHSTVQVIVI